MSANIFQNPLVIPDHSKDNWQSNYKLHNTDAVWPNSNSNRNIVFTNLRFITRIETCFRRFWHFKQRIKSVINPEPRKIEACNPRQKNPFWKTFRLARITYFYLSWFRNYDAFYPLFKMSKSSQPREIEAYNLRQNKGFSKRILLTHESYLYLT